MTGEHRGYTYHIVLQVGGGWRWTVEHDGKEKTGSKRFRDDSIRHAKRCIDELIRKADIKEARA